MHLQKRKLKITTVIYSRDLGLLGQYTEFLLKVSSNFSTIFVSNETVKQKKIINEPLAKFNLARGYVLIYLDR